MGPGRGSAAGCCVAYCLRIVDLDPIRYDLLFERFLNPGRKQMPDIDMDFDERYRSEMIRYAAERYGWDRVAQIVTFSTIKARAAVRDAARVLGYPYSLGDRVAKLMPPLVMGRDTPLWACLEEHPKFLDGYKQASELRELCAADPDVAKVVDVARGLEGLRRQDGIHAAAVVISADPLTEYLPDPAQARTGRPARGRPDRHPVRNAWRRGAGAAQDGLPRPAKPLGDRADPGSDRKPRPVRVPTSTMCPWTIRRHSPCFSGPTPSASSSSKGARCATWCAPWRRPSSRTSPPWSPCTGPARWRPTCTTTTPTARTAGSPSCTSIRTWRRCSVTRTACASTRSR